MSEYAYTDKQLAAKVIREMSFQDIEERRRRARIGQSELCETAGIHTTTYSRLKNRPGRQGATEATLLKLSAALDKIAERDERAA